MGLFFVSYEARNKRNHMKNEDNNFKHWQLEGKKKKKKEEKGLVSFCVLNSLRAVK